MEQITEKPTDAQLLTMHFTNARLHLKRSGLSKEDAEGYIKELADKSSSKGSTLRHTRPV